MKYDLRYIIFALILVCIFASLAIHDRGKIIGGDRDEYGCLGSAGYSWCEAKEKCIRAWEEDCSSGDPQFELLSESIDVAKMFAKGMREYIEEEGNNLRVVNAVQAKCPGCWEVEIEYSVNADYGFDAVTVNVMVENLEVSDHRMDRRNVVVLTTDECSDIGGRVVDTSGGESCKTQERTEGEVHGFESVHLCCV
ncbi:MAG: hypothetical protein KAJ54_01230 [Candidatus Aenigmarchaeota archaeon]|nr:hypothetical protein [Candidatus Aenigmarchaeota archaeon]